MSLVDLIGAILTLFGLFFFFFGSPKKDPVEALRKRLEEREPPPLPEVEDEDIQIELPNVIKQKNVEPQKFSSHPPKQKSYQETQRSLIADFVKKIPDKRYLLVSQIIFGKPKSLE